MNKYVCGIYSINMDGSNTCIDKSKNNTDFLNETAGIISENKRSTLSLYICALSASLVVFCASSCIVWSSPVIPKLTSTDPEINPLGEPITPFQTTLITGIPSYVAMLGNIIFAKMPNAFGRKNSLFIISSGMLVSLITVAFGNHIYAYSVGLCCLFMCVAGMYVVLPLYLSEISEDHNRGRILSIMGILMPLGNLYGFTVGPVTSVMVFTLFLALPVLIHLMLVAFVIPETPVYLISKKRIPSALGALTKLRPNKNSAELKVDCAKIEDTIKSREVSTKSGFLELFKTKTIRKALIISLGINLTQELSGIISIMKFLAPIFNEVSTSFSGNNVAILVGIVKFFSFFSSSCLVEKLGRRILLLTSSLGCCISLFLIGLFFFLKQSTSVDVTHLSWLPIISVLVFSSLYALGLGTISMTVMNELFPTDIKAVGSAFVFTICYLLGASQVFLFPLITDAFGVHYCVWTFSFCCCLGFIFMFVVLPETKNKSFLEIQAMLSKR